jgi:hypothetical protein
MTPLHFWSNSVSDQTVDSYLKDTQRYQDYCVVRDQLLPELIASIEQLPKQVGFRFTCLNRFEGQYPALRVQCPVGFVPDVITIEFPPRDEFFCVQQASQVFKVQGIDKLENHLRVLLVMGLAHWSPR